MKVLITGFEPFLEHSTNPTQSLVRALGDSSRGGLFNGSDLQASEIDIRPLCLPVEFERAASLAIEEIESHRPDWVILLGFSAQLKDLEIAVEENAINQFLGVGSFGTKDNRGRVRSEWTIEQAPALLKTQLPINEIVRALRAEDFSAHVSQSAGTYVCNDLFFRVLHHIQSQSRLSTCKAGFVHIGQLPVSQSLRAVNGILEVLRSKGEILA